MRVLLDEQLPHRLRHLFPSNVEVITVSYLGWKGTRNGELLRQAQGEGFDVLVRTKGNRVMTLAEKLDKLRQGSAERIPAETRAIMHQATDDLRTSGILDGVLKAGELRRAYSGFGLDLEKFNGDASWTLPMPTRAVIGSDGKILSVDTDPDYTRRPEPETTVEFLASLA